VQNKAAKVKHNEHLKQDHTGDANNFNECVRGRLEIGNRFCAKLLLHWKVYAIAMAEVIFTGPNTVNGLRVRFRKAHRWYKITCT